MNITNSISGILFLSVLHGPILSVPRKGGGGLCSVHCVQYALHTYSIGGIILFLSVPYVHCTSHKHSILRTTYAKEN